MPQKSTNKTKQRKHTKTMNNYKNPALVQIAQIITRDGEAWTDGELLEAVHEYLVSIGINPEDYRPKSAPKTAPLQIADASSAVASPEFTASTPLALRSAVNPCTSGDPHGWAVFCSDHNDQWCELGFQDEEAAERFAQTWRNYNEDNAARVGIAMIDTRAEWHGEPATIATGCQECDHVQEFQGWRDDFDTAHFPCPACGAIFTLDNFTELMEEDEPQNPQRVLAGLARGLYAFIEFKKPEPHTRLMYISLGEYNEETQRDTYGRPDETIFYYATAAEIIEAIENPARTVEGWSISKVVEWVIE